MTPESERLYAEMMSAHDELVAAHRTHAAAVAAAALELAPELQEAHVSRVSALHEDVAQKRAAHDAASVAYHKSLHAHGAIAQLSKQAAELEGTNPAKAARMREKLALLQNDDCDHCVRAVQGIHPSHAPPTEHDLHRDGMAHQWTIHGGELQAKRIAPA